MDFPSIPAEGMARSSPEQLNLLDNDNLLLDLDDKTLQVKRAFLERSVFVLLCLFTVY